MTWCSTTGASALKRVIRGWRAALRAWAFSAALLACGPTAAVARSEEHTSELQSQSNLVCRLLLEKKKNTTDFARKSNPVTKTPRNPIKASYLIGAPRDHRHRPCPHQLRYFHRGPVRSRLSTSSTV